MIPHIAARELLGERIGLRLDPGLRARLDRCIAEAAAAGGLTLEEYAARLPRDDELFQDLLNRVTVQETSFFRHPSHWEALVRDILPLLPDTLTIWSAGCATGEEPYSLAMVLEEAGRDWRIVATDISTRALAHAQRGRYKEAPLRWVSDARRRRFFKPSGDAHWQIHDDIRSRVNFIRHNLTTDPPPLPLRSCPLVFCRNVLIYVHKPELQRFVDSLADWMRPPGILFLGFSESLWQLTDRFTLVRQGDAFVYRMVERSTGAAAPPKSKAAGQRPAAARKPPAVPPPPSPVVLPPRPAAASEGAAWPGTESFTAEQWLAAGEAAASARRWADAVEAFRRAVYLDPGDPVAHFQLGVSLEGEGDLDAARRAFLAARTALLRSKRSQVQLALEGYGPETLLRVLASKLEPPPESGNDRTDHVVGG